jgi:hypothetical protein
LLPTSEAAAAVKEEQQDMLHAAIRGLTQTPAFTTVQSSGTSPLLRSRTRVLITHPKHCTTACHPSCPDQHYPARTSPSHSFRACQGP